MTHRPVLAIAIVLSLFCPASRAFYDPPYITPEHPLAGEPVAVNVHCGICDTIAGGIGSYPEITRDGDSIRILFWSVHYDESEFCNFPIGTGTYSIGAYPPGSYVLRVERFDHLLLSGEPATETLGVIPFTVSGDRSPPASAPALNPVGSSLLLFVLVALAARSLHATRSAAPTSQPHSYASNRRWSRGTRPGTSA